MKFSYEGYKRGMLVIPLVIVTICLIVLLIFVIITIKRIKTWNKIDYLKNILGYIIILFFLWAHIGNLKHGLPLLRENVNQACIVEGKIEDIKTLTFSPRMIRADDSCLITISKTDYFIMSTKNLKIGDNVEIKYLPKSTIVLEVKIIETE